MAFTLNLVALLLVLALTYVGMVWLSGFIHRSRYETDEDDLQDL